MIRITAMFVLGLLATSSMHAQEITPTPQHKKLAELEGKWSFVLKSEGSESKGATEYKLECGGLWLTSDFNTDFGGMKFQGKGLDGYDPAKKKYVSVWVDSMTMAPMMFEGDYDAKGEKLTMTANAAGPDGKPAKWKSVTTIVDKNKHTFDMYLTPQGGEEMKMMTVEYTRQ